MLLPFLIFTAILYFIAVFLQGFCIKTRSPKFQLAAKILSFCAISSHGFLLFLFVHSDKNINSFVLISLASCFINLVTYLSALEPVQNLAEKRNIEKLSLFTFPIAIISLLLSAFFNHTPGFLDTSSAKPLFHILLSTLTFTAICFGALQAIILAVQDRKLRKDRRGLTSILPSIESMERFLFQILTIGFILLTVLLTSSVILFFEIHSAKLINKFILSFSAWIVLAILLGGRFYAGWRGSIAIRWTLFGTSLLMLIYFGSLL